MGCGNGKLSSTPGGKQQPVAGEEENRTLLGSNGAGGMGLKGAPSQSDFRIKVGEVMPNFFCQTTTGSFKFHDFLNRSPAWTILFSYPGDFDPVSFTELQACQKMAWGLAAKGVKFIGVSCDSLEAHKRWSTDLLAGAENGNLAFPLIADERRHIVTELGVLDSSELDSEGQPKVARALFVIGPDKTNRLTMLHPEGVGRGFGEVLRTVEALLATHGQPLAATPANWQPSRRLLVAPSVPSEEAQQQLGDVDVKSLPSGRGYVRYIENRSIKRPSGKSVKPPAVSSDSAAASRSTSRAVKAEQQQHGAVQLGAVLVDLECETLEGRCSLHSLLDKEPVWTVLIAVGRAFTPVATTELAACQRLSADFRSRGVKLVAISSGSVAEHREWSQDIVAASKSGDSKLAFPLIADENGDLSAQLGLLSDKEDARSAPGSGIFIVSPHKTVHLSLLYPASVGLSITEALRAADCLAVLRDYSLATPASWERGQRLVVPPSVPTGEAAVFNNLQYKNLPSGDGYMRFVDCPEGVLEPMPMPGTEDHSSEEAAPIAEQPQAEVAEQQPAEPPAGVAAQEAEKEESSTAAPPAIHKEAEQPAVPAAKPGRKSKNELCCC